MSNHNSGNTGHYSPVRNIFSYNCARTDQRTAANLHSTVNHRSGSNPTAIAYNYITTLLAIRKKTLPIEKMFAGNDHYIVSPCNILSYKNTS